MTPFMAQNKSVSFALMCISGDVTWPIIAEKDCNGTQQSPIDIITTSVQTNANLTPFNFTGYDDKTTLTEIKNNGKTSEYMFKCVDDNKMSCKSR